MNYCAFKAKFELKNQTFLLEGCIIIGVKHRKRVKFQAVQFFSKTEVEEMGKLFIECDAINLCNRPIIPDTLKKM